MCRNTHIRTYSPRTPRHLLYIFSLCLFLEHHFVGTEQLELAVMIWDQQGGAGLLGQELKPKTCQNAGQVLGRPDRDTILVCAAQPV
mmetsp:Transcript_13533/g.36193  ORF Transcript_13533/g.36193 Transcript_13533/m.36193 type:complete len:87 (-) Transcript_13533:2704-2964(-)